MTRKKEILALLAILALAAFFRFSQITGVPPGLYPDEAANGNNALEALESGRFKVFYPENNGREGLFINIQAVAIKLFGAEPWALRVVSALFGTLTVLGIYLLTKELFNKPEAGSRKLEAKLVALLASFFLATSFWHINFSRVGFRAIMVPFFAVFAAYWLLKALRTGKISSAVLGGLTAGLGFHTYIAFRFMPFVFAVPMLFSLFRWRKERTLRGGIIDQSEGGGEETSPLVEKNGARLPYSPCIPCVVAIFLFITLIAALPIGFYFLQHPADFFGRGGQVSIFSSDSPLTEFAKSTALTIGMFNVRGDCNGRHNLNCQPELFWPVGVFFLVGLAITIRDLFRRPRSPIPYTLSAWFFFLMLPATLTREGLPHALRAIGMIPPVMIFAGMGAAWLGQKLWQYVLRARENPGYARYRRQLGRIQVELAIVTVLILVAIAGSAYRAYFIRFANSAITYDAFAVDLWHQGQYAARLPDDIQTFVIVNLSGDDIRGVGAPAQTIMFATKTFGERERARRQIRYVRRLEDIPLDGARRTAIIPMNALERGLIGRIRERFPALEASIPEDFLVFQN